MKRDRRFLSKNLIILKSLFNEFPKRRKFQFILVLFFMILSGLAEIFSLASLIPFLVILTNPDKLLDIEFIQSLMEYLGIESTKSLLVPCTILFLFSVIFSSFVRLLNLWLNGQVSSKVGHDLSTKAYLKVLSQPYQMHLESNSGAVISSLTTDIGKTVAVINTSLDILTSLSIVLSIVTTLFFVNSSIALFLLCIFGTSYLFIAKKSQKSLSRNSKESVEKSKKQIKLLQEGLGAIRDITINSSHLFYLKLHKKTDLPLRKIQVQNSFLRGYPRYTLEAIGIIVIASTGLVLSLSDSPILAIPTLGTIALGAQRLLPSLQSIYGGWATINAYISGVESVLSILNKKTSQIFINKIIKPYSFLDSICFKDVSFSYSDGVPIFKKLNLYIKKGERLGIKGTTGSGKSTLIDLIIGLLIPSKGRILIDGIDLHDPNSNINQSWMKAIGHVPQNIFLIDSSIAENIAFGVPPSLINFNKVKKVAEQAQLKSFIESHPDGYKRIIGERGSRLSGGQRQRIGIARALYKDSKILVFDEATSALDKDTEKILIKEIEIISRELTVIMIAHRLSTLSSCDKIIEIKSGKILS